MTITLREAIADAPVKSGNRWRVVVARPGQGSSGNYSEEVFKRDAEKIVPKGGQCFINHDDSRNPKDLVGVYPEGAHWDEDEKAVVGELEVFSHWKAFVEEVGPHLGVSLYARGMQDEDGNVTEFVEDRLNGADLVARPGLIGSGLAEKLYESARAQTVEKPDADTSAQETRKESQEMDEIKEALAALTSSVAGLVERLDAKEAAAAAEVETETAVAEAVDAFEQRLAQVEGADLFDSQKESLRAAAKRGEDVAPLIEEAQKIHDEAVAQVAESKTNSQDDTQGRVLGEGAYAGPTAWGRR